MQNFVPIIVAALLAAASACEQRMPDVTQSATVSSTAENRHTQNYESVGADTTPAAIIRHYYSAINSRRYNDAYALWSQSGKASGKSEADFAAGFAETASVQVTVGDSVRVEGAAGSQYATIPVEVDVTLRDGKHQHFVGTYTLRRAMVDGATAEQRQWRIYAAELKKYDLVAELARDTTILGQSDRSPDMDALSRLLERIGIPFDERLARSERDCMVTGKQAMASPTVSCRIREGAEPVKLHIIADSTGFNELQVLNGAQVIQHIDLAEFERPGSAAAALYAEDIDGDGAREVIMQRFAGATGNTGFTVWRADPAAHRLTPDSAMSSMSTLLRTPGRPCVFQSWNTSAYDHVSMIECYLDNQWKTVWVTSTESIRPANRVARQLKVRVRDTLRLIRADTVPGPE